MDTTVSHYKIIEKLGEGGMGVVYRAEDTKLHRTVALKFLPERAAGSEQDKSRFLQEARAAANLNHPNICTIHAIEEVDGRHFIVMEYVDGVTLREKLPFKNIQAAYDAAIQIGDALAEAHARGIVHRDVKSENIMITPKGQIKVMDFGLAKLKGSLKLTRTSSTVGTLGYMSPEQIQGGEVDTRSDIFSLGVVLFEMITGQLPFRGEHEAAIVYSIVNEPPRAASEFVSASPALEEIFAKVFEKDPRDRYQSAADLAVDLKRLKKQSATLSRSSAAVPAAGSGDRKVGGVDRSGTAAAARESTSRTKLPLVIGGIVLIVVLGYIAFREMSSSGAPRPAMSFARLTELAGAEREADISPDGNYIVYAKPSGNESDLYLQRIGGGNPINLTEGPDGVHAQPAFSPKGDLIAFRSDRDGGGIHVMGSTGESARRVTEFGYNPSWSPGGDKIVFASEGITHPFSRGTVSKLWTVDLKEGKPRIISQGDAVQPEWSPDGKWIVFWGLPIGTGQRELWTVPAAGGNAVRLTDDDYLDWYPVWSPDGGAIYFLSDRSGTMNLWKLRIDPSTGSAAGSPEPVTLPSQNITGLRVSHDASKIIYVATERRANIYRVPFDPARGTLAGSPAPVTEGSREFDYLSVSPDSRWLTFTVVRTQEDIGVMGIDGKGFRKLTNDVFKDRGPVFSPDGRKLAFYSERGGKYQIWTVNVDGSGIEQLTSYVGGIIALPIWRPDGRSLYYQSDTSGQIIDLSADGGRRTITQLPRFPAAENFAGTGFSPDGQYLAGSVVRDGGILQGIAVYSTKDSSYEMILEYGMYPRWLDDDRTMLFLDGGVLKVVDRSTKKVRSLDGLPPIAAETMFAVAPDGRTIYFVKTELESDVWQANIE